MPRVTGDDPFEGQETPVVTNLMKGPRRKRRKLPYRMTYYLPKELCQEIKRIADDNNVPVSDVAHFALEAFVKRYREGKVQLEPTSEVIRRKLV